MSLPLDPLKPVSWDRIDELVELLLQDMPRSLNLYGKIQTALKWRKTAASERVHVYATNIDHFKDGAIVAIYKSTEYFYWVAVHSFIADTRELSDALATTKRIDWNSPKFTICFNGFSEEMRPFVDECRARYRLDDIFDDHLPKKQWKTPDQLSSCTYKCPPDVQLAPLGSESIEAVHQTWVAKYPGAEEHIARFVAHNPSLGVYDITTGELRAWVLCNECSEIALLYVTDDHRRKGYAQLLVNALSDQLLRAGIIAQARIRAVNEPSLKLFKALGFKSSTDTWFVVVGKK